jgi:hypothetical protein
MLSGRTNINNRFARNYMSGEVEVKSQTSGGKIIKKASIRYSFLPAIEAIWRVDDGVRTHDPQNHNLML